jgi:hypothetical protein
LFPTRVLSQFSFLSLKHVSLTPPGYSIRAFKFWRCRFAYTPLSTGTKVLQNRKPYQVPSVVPESRAGEAFESSNLYQLLVTSKCCTLTL